MWLNQSFWRAKVGVLYGYKLYCFTSVSARSLGKLTPIDSTLFLLDSWAFLLEGASSVTH
jgi:hypothetical protein